jgi:hypothetical protein
VRLPGRGIDHASSSFFEDVSPAARRFSDAFYARRNAMPSQIQAGVYSAVRHYLQAVKDTDSDDSATVMARMKATPVSDAYTPNGRIREDQRMVHDLYLVQVKTPGESKGPWDLVNLVATIPPAQAFRPLDAANAAWSSDATLVINVVYASRLCPVCLRMCCKPICSGRANF